MVAAWSVDRLGRSLTDLLDFCKRPGDVSDDGSLCRVRTGHDPRARARRARPSEGAGDQPRPSAAGGSRCCQGYCHQEGLVGQKRGAPDREGVESWRRHRFADQEQFGSVKPACVTRLSLTAKRSCDHNPSSPVAARLTSVWCVPPARSLPLPNSGHRRTDICATTRHQPFSFNDLVGSGEQQGWHGYA
jgi:hypothetical protein